MSDTTNKDDNNRLRRCSFCGRTEKQVNFLIPSPTGAYICDYCVESCSTLLSDAEEEMYPHHNTTELSFKTLPKPKEIKTILDSYVIGQDDAKVALSVAVYNHYKRILSNEDKEKNKNKNSRSSSPAPEDDLQLQKSNVLLMGPTGVGKTYLAQTLAKTLKVPFAIADATTLTEAGYVGDDVENILLRLIQAADYDIALAEKGIIYVDEIDKISRKGENVSITRDVSGEGVQQALLKIIESTIANVPPKGGRKHPLEEYIKIDTTNILFICSGAFSGLDKIIERRIGRHVLGFEKTIDYENEVEAGSDADAFLDRVEPEDLLKFGLIPEFIGRLPVIGTLKALTRDDLVKILTEPKNSLIKQYQEMFRMENCKLTFEKEAVEAIADIAVKKNTGARGLRSITERLMLDIMYTLPEKEPGTEIVITADMVKKSNEVAKE